MKNVNRYVEAFKESYNVVGLAAAVSASLALAGTIFMPVPVLVGLVAETVYLLFWADSRWYQLRLARKFDAEVEQRREQLKREVLPTLRPVMQARFMRLEEVRTAIGEEASDDKDWYREVLRKLDFLLEKFLHFAAKDVQFREYLESVREEVRDNPLGLRQSRTDPNALVADPRGRGTRRGLAQGRNADNNAAGSLHAVPGRSSSGSAPDPGAAGVGNALDQWVNQTVQEVQAHYEREIDEINQLAANESDPNTRAVLEKRCEVLQRRREFVGKIGRIQINLNHQLHLLEDTFGLISDEIRARPPQQVLADIEDVVSQTNTMTQLLEEVAPYEQLLAS
ncbi:MAG TPA: hypothetical protein VF600_10955 [Abditibacteriaceae bacterium]|jgi:hypothetical protein